MSVRKWFVILITLIIERDVCRPSNDGTIYSILCLRIRGRLRQHTNPNQDYDAV